MSLSHVVRILLILTLNLQYSCSSEGKPLGLIENLIKSPVESSDWLEYSKKFSSVVSEPLESFWLFNIKRIKLLGDDPFDVFQEDFFDQDNYQLNLWGVSSPRSKYIRNYFRRGLYEKAIIHLQKEEIEQPDNLYLLMNLTYAYEQLENNNAAYSRISEVIDKSPERDTRIKAYRWRVRIAKKMSNFSSVEKDLVTLRKLLQKKLALIPDTQPQKAQVIKKPDLRLRILNTKTELAEIENFLGITWYIQNKFVLAFDLFENLEKRFPGCYSFSFNKNKIYLEKRRYESTLKSVNSMLRNTRKLAAHFKKISLQKIQFGNLDGAQKSTSSREYFESLVSKLLTRKGEILFREKHFQKALKILRTAVERDPSDSIAWYRIAQINVESNSLGRALIGFRKVIQNTHKKTGLHTNSLEWIDKIFSEQAIQAIKNQDIRSKKQDEFFQNLSVDQRQDLLDLGELVSIGYDWLKSGKQIKLIKMFEPLLSEAPNVLDIYFLLGRANQSLGNVAKAKYYYLRGLKIDSNHIPTIVALTYYDCVSKDFGSALSKIQRLEILAPNDHRVLGARGWYEYQKSNYAEAIRAFQLAVEQNPLYAEHHYRLGMSYLRAGLPRFALYKFDDALSAGYEYSRAHLFKAIALLRLGSFNEGENALRRASDSGKDNSSITGFAAYLLNKIKTSRKLTLSPDEIPKEFADIAVFLNRVDSNREMTISFSKIRQGKAETIIKRLNERIEKDPENYELYHLLSIVHILLNREDLAMEVLEDVIALNPLFYPALNSVAELSFRMGQLDQCVIYWDRMRRVSPLIKLSGNINKLIQEIKKYIDLNPNDQWALYHYVLLEIHQFNDAEALKILESNGVSSNPQPGPYKDALIRLQAMILYRQGVLKRNETLVNQARGLLELSNYRYIDTLDLYKMGTEALKPDIVREWKKKPISESELAFVKNIKTKNSIRDARNVSHPGIRRKATYLSRWNELDEVIGRGNTAPIKSSYDIFVDRRISKEQRYLEDNKARYKRLQENNKKLAVVNLEKANKNFQRAIKYLNQGNFKAVEASLLDAISSKIDFEEAYFGLLTIYLVEGQYSKMKPLLDLLQTFQDSKELLALIKFHLFFHQGDFLNLKEQISKISRPVRIPKNRIIQGLIDIYKEVVSKAPGDFEASLRYGILLQISGRFAEAEILYLKAGQYKGLIPYICESLTARGMAERRLTPVSSAAKKMSEFSASETKDKWLKLAQDIDNYLLTARFLAQ